MNECLVLTTLGDLTFQLGGETAASFSSRKAEALLLYLAVEKDTAHRRESLFTLLWPGMPESSARNNLRQVLFSLRKAIPEVAAIEQEEAPVPLLLADRQNVQINSAAAVDVDIHQIDQLLADIQEHDHLNLAGCEDCVGSLEQVISLYRGNFLANFYMEDSSEFEDWAEAIREAYRGKALSTLEALAEILIQKGDYEGASRYAEGQLKIDPLREGAYRQLMELYSKSGQRTEALRTYQRCARILDIELGTSPSRETTALYEIISGEDLHQTTSTPREGSIRGYQIREHLGSGHTGMVYRAFQPVINRDVAVKVIAPQFANHPDFIRRFEVEAQLVARLEHPYIVPLYDYWRDPSGAYLVMRWLKGGSLQDYLKNGPWMPETAVRLVDQISAALSFAHRQGVVHCDIKPGNILLDEENRAYLTDFGIAILTGPLAQLSHYTNLGEDGSSSGSLGYTSPEVARGQQTTPLADVYSLGVVLFELLTALHPFPGLEGQALIQKHLTEPLPSVLKLRAELPAEVDQVIQHATNKDPGQRFQDVDQLAQAFRQAIHPEIIVQAGISDTTFEVRNPYKGLRSFEEADSLDFFGRDDLVSRLLSRLSSKDGAADPGRFLAVVGPSGSGKSSVVKAGLIPAIRKGTVAGSERWFVVEMTPGSHPLEELETALLRIAIETPEDLLVQLGSDARGLLRILRKALPGVDDEVLLVIDQFEELFTLVEGEADKEQFMAMLAEAINDPHSPLRVVITLRADFYDRPLQYSEFGELVRKATEVVLPLNSEELERAICGPVEGVGMSLEAALVARILQEVGDQPGTLPLLQYALTETFEHREDHQLTLNAYEASGGVLGALGRRAEEIYAGLEGAEQGATRQLFLRLVTLGEGVEDTRRRVMLTEIEAVGGQLSGGFNMVIDRYGRYRLLTFDHDPATRAPTVEVAHEALLREWPRLRGWLDESRDDVRMQRLLAAAMGEWQANRREASYLLRGTRLAQFIQWVEDSEVALSFDEQNYLDASLVARRERETEEAERQAHEAALEHRSRRFLQALVGVFALAMIVAVILSIYAFNAQQTAQTEAEQRATAEGEALVLADSRATQQAIAEGEAEARATQQAIAEAEVDARATAQAEAETAKEDALRQASIGLAAQAELQMIGPNPEQALLLALEAVENYPYTWQAEHALGQIVLNNKIMLDLHHGRWVNSASLSPDGTHILTAGDDGVVKVWETDTGMEVLSIVAHEGEGGMGCNARWSPTGDRILSGSTDGVARVWDADTGEQLFEFPGHGTWMIADWFPDGNRLISWYYGPGPALVWSTINGEQLYTIESVTGSFRKVEISPDGTRIASWEGEIFDADTGEKLAKLDGHGGFMLAWSPDGTLIAGSLKDGKLRVWNSDTDVIQFTSAGGHSADFIIHWSPNGDRLLTIGKDSMGKVWDTETGDEIYTLPGSIPSLKGAWSPDGAMIITAGELGEVKVWDSATGNERLTFTAHTAAVEEFKWFPSGERVITRSSDGSAKIWDLSGAMAPFGCQPSCPRSPFQGWYTSVAWSPDGEQVGRGFFNSSITIWDTVTGNEYLTLQYEPETEGVTSSGVDGLAWSPQGTKLLTTGNDGAARVWNVYNGEELLRLTGYITDSLTTAHWSPDGNRILTTNDLGPAKVWDAGTGEVLLVFSDHNTFDGSWSPDGSSIATCDDSTGNGSVKVWDALTGELLLDLFSENFAYGVSGVAWSHDGTRILTFSEDELGTVWDAKTGEVMLQFPGVPSASGAQWSSSDERFLIGGLGGAINVYNAETGEELITFNFGMPVEASWSPDGTQIAIDDWDGNLWIFPAWQSTEDLIEYAYECCVFRELLPEERAKFGLPEKE